MSPKLGAQLQKLWKILQLCSTMKSAMRFTQAIDTVLFMSGPTDVLLLLPMYQKMGIDMYQRKKIKKFIVS